MFLIRELALGEVGPPPFHKGDHGGHDLVVLFLWENSTKMDDDGVLVAFHNLYYFNGNFLALLPRRNQLVHQFVVAFRGVG